MAKDTYNSGQVAKILEDEIRSLHEYVKYHEEKNIELKQELGTTSTYINEDEKIKDIAETYVKMHAFFSPDTEDEEIVCETHEVYSKMNVLHMQLCNITKKFVRTHFPQSDSHDSKASKSTSRIPEENNFTTLSGPKVSKRGRVLGKKVNKAASGANECIQKKTLLDILKELIYDLLPYSGDAECRTLIVDDTVSTSDIEFLISAGIVKRSSSNPALIELTGDFNKYLRQ